jgi:hypothetical protein
MPRGFSTRFFRIRFLIEDHSRRTLPCSTMLSHEEETLSALTWFGSVLEAAVDGDPDDALEV